MSFDVDSTGAREQRITHCRSCHESIVWLRTEGGNAIPVNANTVNAHDEVFEWGRHVSHFSSCPHANEWRKRR
jgi:hypothetical protein